ncbi:phenylalanine--tRNA ligase subunit beta [Sulfuracidifex metallicus]|uniref:Phenylalanine--tRNA ligase beta subunit n=1 Tax=Sulfuracidifex metallicus DSM 6482 = JCM 9184 TaxID=523847 RepID=A0A6A9QNB7_SULME|nr:phenylalanine--tRNA ligase subunit beta [Sulfuracidifex metallicus]MUN28765.1 phenylalanine--tRNA ligase subunit beta [Sulfuracidifex metallicus DSM 6482 = JCM 9184]WOE50718.1 phenylalanine--tRNA ligase subunit beta [Sulfuracidifex metallicus DSM 6482 = JCM 9184]
MVTINLNRERLLKKLNLREDELEDLLFNLKSESKVSGDSIEIEVNADRPDLFSSDGLKRAIDGLKERAVGEPKYPVFESDYELKVEEVRKRPYAIAAIVKEIKLDEEYLKEIIQLQEKLHATIGRKRKKVAIGIHDLGKITSKTIVYKEVPLDYKFVPLGERRLLEVKEVLQSTNQGKEYGNISIDQDRGTMPAIMEENGNVMSIPPVINSEHTRITQKSKDLFIDVTGTSLHAVLQTINILISNLAEGGGKIYSVKIHSRDRIDIMKREELVIDKLRVQKVLGLRLDEKEIQHLLAKDRIDYFLESSSIIIPPYRVDIIRDEDIAEDIAMMYGYSKIEPQRFVSYKLGTYDNITLIERTIKELSIGAGFQEVFTYVLTKKDNLIGDYVVIENPISDEYNAVRNSLIPVILDFLSKNQHSRFPVKIFESGDIVVRNKDNETGYKNERMLTIALMDSKAGYEEIQSPLHQILLNLSIQPKYSSKESPYFIKGRSASVIIGNNEEIGSLGEIRPELLKKFDIKYPVAIAEISLNKILPHVY